MKYAVINANTVAEVIEPFLGQDGKEIPIADRYSSDFVAQLVPIPDGASVTVGDAYDNGAFSAPAPSSGPTADQVKLEKTALVQAHLDAQAQALGYDDIYTAVSYAEEPSVPKFQIEGQALRTWRSLVWEKANQILAMVSAGSQPIPGDDELLAALPAFTEPTT